MSYPSVTGNDSTCSVQKAPAEVPRQQTPAADAASEAVVPLRRWYLPLKGLGEFLLAALFLIFAFPVLLVAACLIKATSKGPVFYLQNRVGRKGKIFRVIKLRTMIDNAEAQTGPVWCTQDDPRITRVGKFLRDTHLDEFPQLINVLLGQMALIGPRPERPEMVHQLEWKIPNYSQRSNIRPGITGLAQLKLPPDSDLDSVRRKQIFDLYYVRQMNGWLDLRILVSTGWLLLWAMGRGAFSLLSLPSSAHVLASMESFLEPDSERWIAQHRVPPK